MTRWGLARRLLLGSGLLCLMIGWAGCRRQNAAPPATPPPPPPPATASAPPPPPPAPKCESAEENCRATGPTRVEIGDSGIDYEPPVEWTYVKAADHGRALEGNGAAVLGLTVVPQESQGDVLSATEKLTAALGVEGVKLDKLKKRLKKAQQKVEGPRGEIDLWEISAGTQGSAPALKGKGQGTALLALARVATEREVVVLGFVVEPDEKGLAGAIMKAVESLAVKQ